MFSTAFVDGLVLAATVQDDRYGASASGGFAPGLARLAKARLAELAAMPRAERHRVVRALVGAVAALPPDAPSGRIGAILRGPNWPESGQRWVAPRVRRGFHASRGLRVTLRRIAVSASDRADDGDRRLDRIGRELALVAEAPWR